MPDHARAKPMSMGARTLPLKALAPAKLNLCLYVGPTRSDGLHEICSLFQAVTLADQLSMEPGTSGEDEVLCPGLEGPNLAAEALACFREQFGWEVPPLRVTIEKTIPVAAGLGGGSADAAAVLRLAVAASGISPDPGELARVAMSLGADVPSQLDPGTSLVSGAGERVERVSSSLRLTALLLTGRGALSTAEVYARADALGLPRDALKDATGRVRRALAKAGGDALALEGVLRNDLQPAAIELEPEAGQALSLLREAGAAIAFLSGSGPGAFGLFGSAKEAEQARAVLEPRWSGRLAVVGAADRGYAGVRSAATTSA
jgi:4-diphosphocytidyl-2-C-methyl-D-erythritol kinase